MHCAAEMRAYVPASRQRVTGQPQLSHSVYRKALISACFLIVLPLHRYKADSQTVEDVLRYTAPPTITSAPNSEGVQGIAGWPSWFRRERAK